LWSQRVAGRIGCLAQCALKGCRRIVLVMAERLACSSWGCVKIALFSPSEDVNPLGGRQQGPFKVHVNRHV
jgi:hypothetical protein